MSVNFGFKAAFNEQDWLSWTNKCLAQSYDASGDGKLKKIDISVTADSFIRLRKFYAKGKEEYYSFNLHQFNDMDYAGNTKMGTPGVKKPWPTTLLFKPGTTEKAT